jgi:hypothetical protein
MRPTAIRLLTLAICATAAVVIPTVTADQAEASSRHVRKYHKRINPGWSDRFAPREIRPVAPRYSPGPACPGNARGIDCKVWPPPIDEDPDRRQSGADV